MPRPRLRLLVAALLTATTAACFLARERSVRSLPLGQPVTVKSPMKAHLHDGSIIVFPVGGAVTRDSITGANATRYSASLEKGVLVRGAALIDVLGVEVYNSDANTSKSAAMTLTAIAGVGLFKAVFGSCPTIYSDSAGIAVLETESFSSSISPLIARRDVDRLRAQADSRGIVHLEVRNEALETHYIDQMELVEVPHAADETVYPAAYGHPIAFRNAIAPRAVDRSGRNVSAEVAAIDGAQFTSSARTLEAATDADFTDWIDLTIPKPNADSVALILRMRSSLLTTLLFYDRMLGRPGAHSLDWMASDMSRIVTIAQFGRWYGNNMGLRVQVLVNGKYEQVGRLADFGPIAWRHVALMVPAAGTDSVHIRLAFTTDQWRIDQVSVTEQARRVRGRVIPVASIRASRGAMEGDARANLTDADDSFVVTQPSQRFYADFDAGVSATPRTFLLAAHGYYVEWVRGEWLRNASETSAFKPSSIRMGDLLRQWRSAKDSLEGLFYQTRVPVL